jgi:MFS family permease
VTPGAFGIRSFRFQWSADLLASWAFEMETLVLGWYVMVNTGSVLMLTAYGAVLQLGTLAAPLFGVLGDRLGGRTMLRAMRATYAVLATLVMALALSDRLSPAWALGVAALTGLVRPNDLVMRNALIGETIPPAHRMGALGLSRATMDSARVAGALAGAGLSAALGIGLTYVFVTAFYLASLALTFGVARRPAMPQASATVPPSGWRDLKAGIAHVLATPALLATMWLAFLINLTAYPFSGGLLPYAARAVYRVDATGLGWLAASFSLGALAGSITMVLTGGPRQPARATVVSVVVWYALLLGFAHVSTLTLGMTLLLAAGFVQSIGMISMTATLLGASAPAFRGRVMGVRTLVVYGLPVGLMTSGLLIERVGYPLTVSALAALGVLFTLLIAMRWRAALWRPQRSLIETRQWMRSSSGG